MKIILLGAPGSGKGTQAKFISEKLGIVSISTGDMIREALKSGSEIGLKAKSYMDSGKLVPDEVVIGIVKDRVSRDDCSNGFILDGFPRTIPQAEALDKMGVSIDKVLLFDIADEIIVNRMSGRRVCTNCKSNYHVVYNKPKRDNICDICENALIQREDDNPETVKARLKIYHEQTEPLRNFYQKMGKLVVIDANKPIEEVASNAIKALEA